MRVRTDGSGWAIGGAVSWLECAALAAICVGAGHALFPEDPLFLEGPFSWLAIPVLLAGFRYGTAGGFVTAALVTAVAMRGWMAGAPGLERFPLELIAGLMSIAMVSGEFCDGWKRRLARAESQGERSVRRLELFARAYHLLRVSHHELEERQVGGAASLRELLTELSHHLSAASAQATPLETLGRQMLELFARAGQAQIAALHLMEGEALNPVPMATLGRAQVSAADPMIQEAIHTRSVVAIRPGAREQSPSLLWVVVPLVDVSGALQGVVAVQEMAFTALHERTLRTLSVLGAHVGDLLSRSLREPEPRSVRELHAELRRELSRARRDGAAAALLRLEVPRAVAAPALAQVRGTVRCLDRVFMLETGDTVTLAIWLPFTGTEALTPLTERVRGAVTRITGEAPVAFATRVFEPGTPLRAGEETLRGELGLERVEGGRRRAGMGGGRAG